MTGGVIAFAAAFFVGAALAVSGAALQSVLRNPLAEPYLLGTVGGAALFAALAINLGLTAIGAWVMPTASFLGSCVSLGLVCAVAMLAARSRRAEGTNAHVESAGNSLVLAGFVTGGFMGSLDMLVLSYAKPEDFTFVSKWLYGSLANVSPTMLALGGAALIGIFAALLALSRRLNVMELGRIEAATLGVNVRGTLLIVFALVALSTAVSVAMAGAIGFIGLVVPHFVRRRVGPRMQRILPIAAICGGLFLMLAESLRRLLPGEVPVGVVCAIVGAPLFFGQLVSRHSGEGWDI